MVDHANPSVGTLAAWLVVMYRFPGHGILVWGLALPFAMPAFAMAYAYADLLELLVNQLRGLGLLGGSTSGASGGGAQGGVGLDVVTQAIGGAQTHQFQIVRAQVELLAERRAQR